MSPHHSRPRRNVGLRIFLFAISVVAFAAMFINGILRQFFLHDPNANWWMMSAFLLLAAEITIWIILQLRR